MKISVADLRLVEKWSSEQRGIFSTRDLRTALDEKHQNAFHRRLRTLRSNGVLRRFTRGWYVTQNFDLATLSQRLAPDSYISFTTVLAQNLLVGTSPERRVIAAKIGKTRTYDALGYEIVHVGIAPHLFFGFETRDGVRYADKEKAVLDVLYFHLRGRIFPFDLYSDIRFEELDKRRIGRYLKRYENQKFISFAGSVLSRKEAL
jgi:predicted transcriptional regulator of viral defense system